LLTAWSLAGLSATPAAAQSRLSHERRIKDLEGVTQEFVELQTGQALRWSEMETQLQAHAEQLNALRAEVSTLRQVLAQRETLVKRQQTRIALLNKQATVLKAHLAAREAFSAIGVATPDHSQKQSLAEVFRARRPPPRPAGNYYRPTGTERSRQNGTGQRYVSRQAPAWAQ
jgi:septal ring factor EnvC (AmiA/AmiB activator)